MTRCACGAHAVMPDLGYFYDSKSPERHHYLPGRTEGCEAAQLRELVSELAATLDAWADAKDDQVLIDLLERARRASRKGQGA